MGAKIIRVKSIGYLIQEPFVHILDLEGQQDVVFKLELKLIQGEIQKIVSGTINWIVELLQPRLGVPVSPSYQFKVSGLLCSQSHRVYFNPASREIQSVSVPAGCYCDIWMDMVMSMPHTSLYKLS